MVGLIRHVVDGAARDPEPLRQLHQLRPAVRFAANRDSNGQFPGAAGWHGLHDGDDARDELVFGALVLDAGQAAIRHALPRELGAHVSVRTFWLRETVPHDPPAAVAELDAESPLVAAVHRAPAVELAGLAGTLGPFVQARQDVGTQAPCGRVQAGHHRAPPSMGGPVVQGSVCWG
jgi:hypothetical protein